MTYISLTTNSSISNKSPYAFAYTIGNTTTDTTKNAIIKNSTIIEKTTYSDLIETVHVSTLQETTAYSSLTNKTKFSNLKKNSNDELTNETNIWTSIKYIQDEANVLTDAEEAELWANCMSISKKHDISIFILTTNSVPTNRKLYIEDFYDTNINSILVDSIIILVNMDRNNRGVEIQGYGLCEFWISDDRIEIILDKIVTFLSASEYYGAFSTYISEVDKYMALEPASNSIHTEEDNLNYSENYYNETKIKGMFLGVLFNLLISTVIAGIIVMIMVINSKGKVTVNQNTYLDPKSSRVLGHWDRYIRTTVTKKPKPKENNNSTSRGGGGRSSGGHSHSGGGRSF